LEAIRKEGRAIKAAPWSFVIVCAVVIVATYGAFKWIYSDKLADANRQIGNLKGDVEHWRDVATRQPSQQPARAAPYPPNTKDTANAEGKAVSATKKEKKDPPPPAVDCPNGICAGRDITGSPTVNNYGPKLPNVTWSILKDKAPIQQAVNPQVWVRIGIDRDFVA
jgi:hypothetical protein